jgi:uncharacterized protein YbjT (DUF2867 family)
MQDVNGVVVAVESSDYDDSPNSPERVHYQGTCSILAASTSTAHIVLVTQIYITRPERYSSVRNVIYWRRQAEEALRASGLPYTIVRPGWLTNAPGSRLGIRLEQGDTGDGEVTREDVAEACVQALLNENARGKSFEIYNKPGSLPNWREVFASLYADPATIRTESR